MNAPTIHPAGRAGVAASAAPLMSQRWRTLLGALLLTLTPGLTSAGATEPKEWPTAPDYGPRATTRIPWLSFSGDPTTPVLAMAPGHAAHAHEVVVVREQELSRRQRRLLRRAERREEKAARLRAKAGLHGPRSTYATVVVRPVVQPAPPAPPAPPRPVVYRPEPPGVHVVRLEREAEHEDCHAPDEAQLAAEIEALAREVEALEREEDSEVHVHAPVVIDVEKISADARHQVEQAVRAAERARERAEHARERAEHARERSQRDRERAMERGPHRSRG